VCGSKWIRWCHAVARWLVKKGESATRPVARRAATVQVRLSAAGLARVAVMYRGEGGKTSGSVPKTTKQMLAISPAQQQHRQYFEQTHGWGASRQRRYRENKAIHFAFTEERERSSWSVRVSYWLQICSVRFFIRCKTYIARVSYWMLCRAPTHKRAISWEEGWNLTSGGSCARCRQASKPCCRWQARIAVFLFPSTFLNRHRFFNSASLYNRDLEQKHDTQIAVWSINASGRYSASAKQGHTYGRVFRAAVGNLRIRPADSLQIVVTVRPA